MAHQIIIIIVFAKEELVYKKEKIAFKMGISE